MADIATVDPARIVRRNAVQSRGGPVIYWMSREQRVRDNWALLYACELAAGSNAPVVVAFCLNPHFLGAGAAHYSFMLEGLAWVETDLAARDIGFRLLEGRPAEAVGGLASELEAGAVVSDFDPLRIKSRWRTAVARVLGAPFYEVDAHNIVPCRVASAKQEYSAATIRPGIQAALAIYLNEFPPIPEPRLRWTHDKSTDWAAVRARTGAAIDNTSTSSPPSGERTAAEAMAGFIEHGLDDYAAGANDPNSKGRSHLSPYIHFGQLSAQRLALEVGRADARPDAKASFLEELIVRRELSDNFCLHNRHYDSFSGFPAWARRTLDEHRGDPREYLYTYRQLDRGLTHDDLWNAAQFEMRATGYMHGYVRMYWAKKILEWTRSPEEALKIAVKLNDRYELDGRDPNGYTGIAWSIGGVHDRAWGERAVFGKIRYMSLAGCRRKFDVDAYIRRVNDAARETDGRPRVPFKVPRREPPRATR